MGERVDIAFYNSENKGWGTFLMFDWAGGEITHWMPLPEIPNAMYSTNGKEGMK